MSPARLTHPVLAPHAPMLTYAASRADQGRTTAWPVRALLVLAALPAAIAPFVPFTYGIPPSNVALELLGLVLSLNIELDHALGLLALPFFLGVALLAFRVRLLVAPRATRWEGWALLVLAGIAASGTAFFSGLLLKEAFDRSGSPQWEDVTSAVLPLSILSAGVVILSVRFSRGDRTGRAALTATHTAYLANAALCLFAFRHYADLGWWVTALACALLIAEPGLRMARGWALKGTVCAAAVILLCMGCAQPTTGEADAQQRLAELEAEPQTPEVLEEKRQLLATLLNRLELSNVGTFRLKGTVTDPAGNQLQGVVVAISLKKPGDPWRDWEPGRYDEERIEVNGRFDLRYRGYTAVTLTFMKRGYYAEELSWSGRQGFGEEEIVRLLQRGVVKPAPVEEEGIMIVLEPQGRLTQLTTYRTLFYDADGTGGVIDFDQPPPTPAWRQRPRIDLKEQATWPRNGAVFLAQAADGLIVQTEVPAPPPEIQGTLHPEGRLILSGDGGLQFYTSRDEHRWKREMKQAPLNGYTTKELVIDREFLLRLRQGDDSRRFFYFKVGDKFGKGRIGMTRSPNFEPAVAELDIAFYLQPDGSRNLEDGSNQ